MFAEQTNNRAKRHRKFDLKDDSDTDEAEVSGRDSDEMDRDECKKRKKTGPMKSDMYAKASSTCIVKQVPHAHSVLDEDKLENWKTSTCINYHSTCS